MKALLSLTLIELKLSFRNFIYIFFAFVFPPMMMLLFGGIYGNSPSPFYGGYGAVDVLTPSYIAMLTAVSGIMGMPLQLADYRQNKVLKRFKATPVRTSSILAPHFITNALICIAATCILIAVGILAFDLSFFGNIFAFVLAFLLSVGSIFSMGFVIAAVAPNSRAAGAIAYLVYFPMLFLSGSTVPLEIMPNAIVKISKALPLTYCVDILKGTWLGNPVNEYITAVIILLAIMAACVIISLAAFRWE